MLRANDDEGGVLSGSACKKAGLLERPYGLRRDRSNIHDPGSNIQRKSPRERGLFRSARLSVRQTADQLHRLFMRERVVEGKALRF